MNSNELSKRICDCLSDVFYDEQSREETEIALYNELSQIDDNSFIKDTFEKMCGCVEELESVLEVAALRSILQDTREEIR